MDRSKELILLTKTYTTDDLDQYVESTTEKTVFCNVQSVTRAEWLAGGQQGLKPELVATMFAPDYEGQDTVKIEGVVYGVYRVYRRQDELLELYLERKVGAEWPSESTN